MRPLSLLKGLEGPTSAGGLAFAGCGAPPAALLESLRRGEGDGEPRGHAPWPDPLDPQPEPSWTKMIWLCRLPVLAALAVLLPRLWCPSPEEEARLE